MDKFKLVAQYRPKGDQPQAIEKLITGINAGARDQVLLGVTGSGKTYTMANVIASINKPTLVLAHNKTLAAQLFSEFKEFFPENAVEYFISYYDYYQPEAYVAHRDLYIEKETDINQDIERYRNAATQSILTRKDVIVIASVSCIYGLGNPEDYTALARTIKLNSNYPRNKLISHLTDMQYYRSEYDFYPGLFRVRGDTLDINLVAEEKALRIEFFDDTIESLKLINSISGEVIEKPQEYTIFPAKQYVTTEDRIKSVLPKIEADLQIEKEDFLKQGKLLEATRLDQRVKYDLELLKEVGFCTGIENYSRYIDGRKPGSPPSTLLDYLGEDWLLIADESHITMPQVRGMYNGDRARKLNLVEYGFRLKAALDNRPLKFIEFQKKLKHVVYVSATPAEYEIELAKAEAERLKKSLAINPEYTGIVEQIIRPTGLLDPEIYLRPTRKVTFTQLVNSIKENNLNFLAERLDIEKNYDQIDDLLIEIKNTINKNQRVIVTTLTKRMAEDLTTFLAELKIKVQYIHSDIDAIERVDILRDLRLGIYDVIVGINLLREGLDLPEVSLVAILDADKEGFLRSNTSLVQTIGRAARHSEGKVIMYADKITGSMKYAIEETMRRRKVQEDFNRLNNITPTTIVSKIKKQLERAEIEDKSDSKSSLEKQMESYPSLKSAEKKRLIVKLKVQMEILADSLEFEKAAQIRDFLARISP